MIREISSRLILVTLDFLSRETIQIEERTSEQDIIAITQDLKLKLVIGHVETGKLEDRYQIILRANNVV
jgi:hypothetical protein